MDLLDIDTPRNTPLSGKYKKSFAYHTLSSRLPSIFNDIIKDINNSREELIASHGENISADIESVTSQIHELITELQNNKKLKLFNGVEQDKHVWNEFLNKLGDHENTFYTTCWLYAECYMYRRVSSFIENSQNLKSYDYFAKQKQNALLISAEPMTDILNALQNMSFSDESLETLLKLNLWGNRCDLSISVGKEVKVGGNPFDLARSFDKNLIADSSKRVVDCLKSADRSKPVIIDFILDNSGYELFTDFALADYLIESKLADKVRFHVKAIPWFISDVTLKDFDWTLQCLKNHDVQILKNYAMRWLTFLDEKKFEVAPVDHFWTSPYEYYQMRMDLYNQLMEAHLIILKGDLNYRKLVSDFSWDPTESFTKCLKGFQPSNICSLRTVKSDLICGLKPGQAEQLHNQDQNWMITGEYGVIQFSPKDKCTCPTTVSDS